MQQLINITDPDKAKSFARNNITVGSKWKESKRDIMLDCYRVRAKFDPAFVEALIATGKRPLVHNMETDCEWGFGENGEGDILQEFRHEVCSEKTSPKR